MMKRILSILLAAVLFLSTGTAAVYAKSNEEKKHKQFEVYTALGDSASSGYGLEDYAKYGSLVVFNKRIKGSYVDLLGKDVGAKTVHPLGVSGIRTSELLYLLNDKYHGDYMLDSTMGTLSNGVITRQNLKPLKKQYQQAVKDADLITLDIGFDDIWVPTIGCIYDIAEDGRWDGDDAEKTVADLIEQYGSLEVVIENVISYLFAWYSHPQKWAYYWDKWVLTVTKWAADFKVFYGAIVDTIFELNPDVTLVAVGCYNPCNNWDIIPGDRSIEHTIQPYYDLINSEKKSYQIKYDNYHYVSLRNVETITKGTTLPLYEYLTLDDSGFNPHPTPDGHKDIEARILKVLDSQD